MVPEGPAGISETLQELTEELKHPNRPLNSIKSIVFTFTHINRPIFRIKKSLIAEVVPAGTNKQELI